MSWDVAIVRIRGKLRSVNDVEEEDYRPLGALKDVRAAVRSAFPQAEWDDATRAVYLGPDFEIEFALDGVKSANTILLHVHGTGDPIPSILQLTQANGWLAIDTSLGEFIDPNNPCYEGWEGFKGLVRGSIPVESVIGRGQKLGDVVIAPKNAAHFAADTVKKVQELDNITLDYSVGSLRHIDDILKRFHNEGVSVQDVVITLFCFGCYVGEVIVRHNPGARWISLAEDETESELDTGMVVRLASGTVINPIGKAEKRLLNGKNSLQRFYKEFVAGNRGSA